MRFQTRLALRLAVFQRIDAAGQEAVIPPIEGRTRGMPSLSSVRLAGRCDCSTSRMISSFSEAGYLIRRRPHPDHAFFEQPQFQRLFGHDLFQVMGLATQMLDLVDGGRTRRVAGQPLLAGFEELLRPVVIEALGNAFAPAQRGNAVLATQAFQHDADLLFRRILLAGRAADVLDWRVLGDRCPSSPQPQRHLLHREKLSASSFDHGHGGALAGSHAYLRHRPKGATEPCRAI
jgi:hypothetical protein